MIAQIIEYYIILGIFLVIGNVIDPWITGLLRGNSGPKKLVGIKEHDEGWHAVMKDWDGDEEDSVCLLYALFTGESFILLTLDKPTCFSICHFLGRYILSLFPKH